MTRFRLATPDPRLPAESARVRDELARIVPFADVYEVGATALGAPGKGDLDVLVRVDAARFVDALARLDRVYRRDPDQHSSPIYQGYTVSSPLDVALQVTVANGPHDTFLTFLDALRADPRLLAAYVALKHRWDDRPMDDYRRDKASFVELVLASRSGGDDGAVAGLLARVGRDPVEADPEWPSPCHIGVPDEDGSVAWAPVRNPEGGHPLARWFAATVPVTPPAGPGWLSIAANAEELPRLEPFEGVVPIAILDWDRSYLHELATGRVLLRDPGRPDEVAAPDLATFLAAL